MRNVGPNQKMNKETAFQRLIADEQQARDMIDDLENLEEIVPDDEDPESVDHWESRSPSPEKMFRTCSGNWRNWSMTNHDLHEEIDQLAVEIEQTIIETQKFLDELPHYAPRSGRSRKIRRLSNK